MDDVGEEVVVLEPVVDADLLVVDGQRAGVDAPLVFLGGVRPELPGKDIQDLLSDPTALKIKFVVNLRCFSKAPDRKSDFNYIYRNSRSLSI